MVDVAFQPNGVAEPRGLRKRSSLRATLSPALGASSAVFIVIAAAAFFLVLRFGRMEQFLFRRG